MPTSRPVGTTGFRVARVIEESYDIGDVSPQVFSRALAMYRTAAKGGHAEAMYRLGVCYQFGKGVEPDAREAKRWYAQAAWLGHRRAIERATDTLIDGVQTGSEDVQLHARSLLKDRCIPALRKLKSAGVAEGKFGYAQCQEYGLGGLAEDPASALACYRALAEAGHDRAIFEMYGCCLHGRCGLQKDVSKSSAYLKAAAKAGYSRAQVVLAVMYLNGQGGVEKDHTKVKPLLVRAGEGGDSEAMGLLASIMQEGVVGQPDISAAILWARRGVRMGDSDSHSVLGQCYLYGLGELRRDPFQAVQHFLQADRTAKAWLLLGTCFQDGLGVDADSAEAIEWFEKAANADNREAQYLLAKAMLDGRGPVKYDNALAIQWLQRAVKGGSPKAIYLLGLCHRDGSGGLKVDVERAFKLFTQAARENHPPAFNALGDACMLGEGCPIDYALAGKHYRAAADKGDRSGMFSLGAGYDRGAYGLTKDRAKALRWYTQAARAGHAGAKRRLKELGVSWAP